MSDCICENSSSPYPYKLLHPALYHPGCFGGIDRAGSLCIDLAIVHGFCLYRIIYKSSNERSRPVKMGRCFLTFRFDSKDPAWSNFDFVSYYVCFDTNNMLFYIISFTGPTSYEPGSESCRVPRHDSWPYHRETLYVITGWS